VVSAIASGLLCLVGVERGDSTADAQRLARKIARLRLFDGPERPFDLSVRDEGGEVLLVSQFTLLAATRKGNRPSWSAAADPADAAPLLDQLAQGIRSEDIPVRTGRFGASMQVSLLNDGPVTIPVDTREGVGNP
jgi:D-tyrosyl-tRNA(Tyr) deacylase